MKTARVPENKLIREATAEGNKPHNSWNISRIRPDTKEGREDRRIEL